MKPLTKSQFVTLLAEKSGMSKKEVNDFLTMYAETVIDETVNNGSCVVPGLGKLVKVHRKERMGRNPATGEQIKIAAKTVAKFRVAKAAKDAVLG